MTYKKDTASVDVYAIKDLKAFKKIIMLLDGYRKLNFEDFQWADQEVSEGKLGNKFARDWKQIRKILLKFARTAGSQKHLLNLAALQQFLLQLGFIMSSITILLMTLGIISFLFQYKWAKLIPQILKYATIPLIIGLTLIIAGPPLIARRITAELEKYYERKPEFLRENTAKLKEVVQKMIYSIIEAIKNEKIKVEKEKDYEFGLFNLDYEGIKVVKEPSFFRKYYIVIPDIKTK